MALQTGTTAPDAVVFTAPRQPVRLRELYRDTTVLLFIPLAFSSTCTEEICTVSDDLARYEQLGAHVYGLTIDSPYVNRHWAQEHQLRFPILSDFNKEASTAFDVLRPDIGGLRGVSERAVFVIDAAGVIRYSWVGEHPGVMPSFDAIQDAVRAVAAAV